MSAGVLVLGGRPGSPGPADAAQPRLDVQEIAATLGARRSPTPDVTGVRGRMLRPLPGDFAHAWRVRRLPVGAFLSLSEAVGLPLALLKETRAAHVVIAHNLTARRRRAVQDATGWLRRVDLVVTVSRAQERYLRDDVGLPAERVRFVFDKVDHRFFAPRGGGDGGYVLSVGAESRDYPTLLEAVRRLGVPAVVVASSLWVGALEVESELPACVTVRRGLSFSELRELYDRAAAVVVPVRAGTAYAAGVNALLEAMAMRKPIVASETPGLAGYLHDGEAMRTVPPGDPAALAAALEGVLGDRAEADRLAGAARRIVEDGRNLDGYVAAVAAAVRETLGGHVYRAWTPA